MKKNLRRLTLMVSLIVSLNVQATPIMTITPITTQLILHPNSSVTLGYTVTSNASLPLNNLTIASLNTNGVNVSVSSNTCTNLAPFASCQFNVTIPGNNQPSLFTIAPKVCASNGAICATVTTNSILTVNENATQHAYVGLNNSVLPITLVPDSPGIVGTAIPGFALNEPAGIAVNSSGSFAYVPDAGSGTIKVINTALNTIVASIPVGITPTAVVLSPDGKYVYAVNYDQGQNQGNLWRIDAATNKLIGNPITVGAGPWALAVSPDGSTVYAANSGDYSFLSSIASVNINTGVVMQIDTPNDDTPFGIVITPDGTKVYVSLQSNNIGVISTASQTFVDMIPVGSGPKGLAVTPDGSKLYVVSFDGTLSTINTTTNTVMNTIFIMPGLTGIALSGDGSQLYLTSDETSAVAVLNTANNQYSLIDLPGVPFTFGNFIG